MSTRNPRLVAVAVFAALSLLAAACSAETLSEDAGPPTSTPESSEFLDSEEGTEADDTPDAGEAEVLGATEESEPAEDDEAEEVEEEATDEAAEDEAGEDAEDADQAEEDAEDADQAEEDAEDADQAEEDAEDADEADEEDAEDADEADEEDADEDEAGDDEGLSEEDSLTLGTDLEEGADEENTDEDGADEEGSEEGTEEDGADEALEEPAAPVRFEIVNVPRGLNLRSGPGASFDVIAGIERDRILTGTGNQDGNWTEVSIDGLTGWVLGEHLSTTTAFDQTIDPADTVAAPAPVTFTVVGVDVGLNLRSGPGVNNDVIGNALLGDTVPATGNSIDGWVEIEANGVIGWVSSDFLSTN